MELKRINLEMKQQYFDFLEDWKGNHEDITPYAARLLERTFEEFVKDSLSYETNPPKEFVKGTTFYLVDEHEIVGAINIRHELNEKLLQFGGHIGYGVKPSQRQKGYAAKMLELTIPFLRELKLEKVLITCDNTNIGSAKVIENAGGILENTVKEKDLETRRYWVEIK